ncbi:MAG TPA: PAS domain-containing sensor histidine kinase [Thermoanaerobaculia bacterium]|nr:PAS domain-containing sensor histidine kinase [Thermoanaerobaculia bacterium]
MHDLLDTAPCGFLTFGDDGTILITNATLREILGYDAGELEGRHIESILSVGGKVFYHTHFFPLLKMQRVAEEIYFSLRSKVGAEVPMLINAVRRERDGRPVNDVIFVRMRQRRRYEDEILRAKRAAEQAGASKARFLSMMSHDLRTPLQAISGFAEVLLQELRGPLNEEQREDVRAIKAGGHEMMRLMNDILNFAQLESGHVEVRLRPMLLGEAIHRAELLLRPRFMERELAFDASGCNEELILSADPDRLQQVLLNLLTNAIKFTPAGGTISISSEEQASQVLIHVTDTGIGIPSERLPDIFEPFVQVNQAATPSDHGVGLGLSISRDLARAMGGDLTAESSPGEGSTFTVRLARG